MTSWPQSPEGADRSLRGCGFSPTDPAYPSTPSPPLPPSPKRKPALPPCPPLAPFPPLPQNRPPCPPLHDSEPARQSGDASAPLPNSPALLPTVYALGTCAPVLALPTASDSHVATSGRAHPEADVSLRLGCALAGVEITRPKPASTSPQTPPKALCCRDRGCRDRVMNPPDVKFALPLQPRRRHRQTTN